MKSPFYFSGNLPERVPASTLATITDTIKQADFDSVELLVYEDEQTFFITGLVFLSSVEDAGYFFRGISDNQGFHVPYVTPSELMDAIRPFVGEKLLFLFVTGDVTPSGVEGNFFAQLSETDNNMLNRHALAGLDENVIPYGGYCTGCPYLSFRADKPEHYDGYCAFLKRGDWMVKLDFSFLWDGLKECKINLN